ncbi:two component transcriptional regulator, AraC family [Janthinobacterium sp. HH01]|uniref:response regulator transcription factor n=1 Tax=Janthinobacterium sp. HH01 TaxID=1198452 RepID=UPI0002AEC130|nr:response regulator [Janthinobacterium sp. HH01]ELX11799.1 two component transcriptional regulator, AraC family [Janthinobacterium sp. HH01]
MFALSTIEQLRPSILVVDDERDEQRCLTDLLRRQLYQVRVAGDGDRAYQDALASRPDLVLLDVRMPRLDGFAACRLLKADPVTQAVPVIFLSAASDPDERVAGLAAGGVDFITKPYHPAEVFARVRIHLELARTLRAATTVAAALVPSPPSAAAAPPHDPDEVFVAAAMRLIVDNLTVPLTLAEIAHAVGTHEKRLSQAFRRHADMTVFAYLAQQRMLRGRQLLAETDMSVQQIAEQTGFRSAANFATAFRERADVTPTAYRSAVRQAGAGS